MEKSTGTGVPLQMKFTMIQRDADMLTQAIERNSAAVLALPSAGMVRYYKSRFLRGIDQRIWLEAVPAERPLIESLIQERTPVVVSFKGAQQQKVNFGSPIFGLDCEYRFFDSDAPVQAVVLHRPAVVKPMQRRNNFRVPVRASDNFTIELWRIAEHVHLKDEPKDVVKLEAAVRDLSVGGVGVIFPSRPLLVPDQRMRVLLKHGDAEPMLLEARAGSVRPTGDAFEAGLHFRELQASLTGRQMLTELTRIVQGLQLEDARRNRGKAG
jgi:c-di-GMP-binding flagellar brake protein YcgR